MPRSPIAWEFLQDYQERWYWVKAAVNGTAAEKSGPFNSYGKCVSDAIRHGFNPNDHSYSNSCGNRTTDFRTGEAPDSHNRS